MEDLSTHLKRDNRALIVGIMGGIASGKSTISKKFCDLGAEIINADKLAHEVLQYEDVKYKIINLWGEGILNNGEIDRKNLAKIVFFKNNNTNNNKTKKNINLRKLEAIVHPILKKKIIDKIKEVILNNSTQVIVLDIALLMETGLHEICDQLIFIDTPSHIRRQRAYRKRGWKKCELEARERLQSSLEQKQNIANFVIKNRGSKQLINKKIKEIYKKLEYLHKNNHFQETGELHGVKS